MNTKEAKNIIGRNIHDITGFIIVLMFYSNQLRKNDTDRNITIENLTSYIEETVPKLKEQKKKLNEVYSNIENLKDE